MKQSALLWLKEKKNHANGIPEDDEERLCRLKEHRRAFSVSCAKPSAAVVSLIARTLLEQNVTLLDQVDRLRKSAAEEESRQLKQQQLLEKLSNEVLELREQLAVSACDSSRVELQRQEQLQRDTLCIHESDARVGLLCSFAHVALRSARWNTRMMRRGVS
ncbi:unnamed protein product [Trypanosoma congolense IL3000]|uniref:WGS project CAEQ00000000 data, annotated contig 2387 n=1 Tax=Trypanosoma congolense (strain IL3000) TaxID=1068625 RepID=F9WDP8_TRYCI|nr:unnamed protein product [Trypanosoma congolense IL3000]